MDTGYRAPTRDNIARVKSLRTDYRQGNRQSASPDENRWLPAKDHILHDHMTFNHENDNGGQVYPTAL